MRQLTYLVACSLDGRIAAADGDFSAFSTTGDHVDALVRDHPDTLPAPAHGPLGVAPQGAEFDTVLMGWQTYAAGLPGLVDPYPHLRQVVFSRRRGPGDVPASVELTGEDPAVVVRRLKAEPGTGIWLCGGGELAGALADEVDRLVLKVNPLVLGETGRPLFAGGRPGPLVLERSTPYASGVVVNEYRRGTSPA